MSEAILDVWEAGGRTLDDEGIELRGIEAVHSRQTSGVQALCCSHVPRYSCENAVL